MEYQKIISPLGNETQPSKFRIKNWVEVSKESYGEHRTDREIKCTTAILTSSLCDYNDAYIFVKGTITVAGQGTNAAAIADDRPNKESNI